MNLNQKRPNRIMVLITSTLVVGGCAHLSNPYIDTKTDSSCTSFSTSKSFAQARACNESLQSTYIQAMSSQAELSTMTGLALLPLTAYTSGLAIKGGNATKVTDFTLAGAGLFGMSSWLSKPKRSEIYGTGLAALQCALTASNGFDQNLSGMTGLTANVRKLIIEVSDASADFNTNSLQTSEVNDAVFEARKQLVNAQKLNVQFTKAATKLYDATRTINNQINIALVNSVPSLASLPGVIQGMTQTYSDLAGIYPGLSAPASQGTDDSFNKENRDGVDDDQKKKFDALRKLTTELKRATLNLTSYLAAMTPSPLGNQLEQCGVNTSSIITALSASQNKITFAGNTANTQTLVVNGGSGQYVHDGGNDNFEITQQSVFGPIFNIKPKSDGSAKLGDYSILIRDTSGGAITLALSIIANEAGSSSHDDGKPITSSCSAEEKGLELNDYEQTLCGDEERVKEIQTILALAYPELNNDSKFLDGNYGKGTKEALEVFAKDHDYLEQDINFLLTNALEDYSYATQSDPLNKDGHAKQLMDLIRSEYTQETDDKKAVAAYQSQLEISVSGYIGETTYQSLCKDPRAKDLTVCTQ